MPIQQRGTVIWKPQEEVPDTPSELEIAALDKTSKGEPSFALVGMTRNEGGPSAELLQASQILEEGTERTELDLQGEILTPQTNILLMEQEGGTWIAREHLSGTLIDFQHIRVQIPAGYLSRPTILALEVTSSTLFPPGAQVAPDWNSVKVYVADKTRPLISAVEPARSQTQADSNDVDVLVHGSGFSSDSRAATSFGENGGDFATKTKYISPSELLVTLPCCYTYDEENVHASDRIELWIKNGDDLHVSDPMGVDFLFAGKLPPRPMPKAFISSISPYPAPLMDYQSPSSTPLHVYGKNFREDEYVVLSYGMGSDDDPRDARLQTKYISPTELLVMLPRDLWRHHRLSYRLVAETAQGICNAELWESSDGPTF